jgi:exopolysaccharide biosynthesis WecB/TagA/CpsF family protein
MRIAIIGSRGYPYVYSGYETFVRELSERLIRQGVGVTVYCHRNLFRKRPKEVNGVRLVYVPTIERKTLSQFVHSMQAVLHACFCRYDVILVVNSANGPFGLLGRIFRKRTAINVDGLEWLRPKWKGLGGRYFYWASKMAVKLYDRVITDSTEMQKIYLKEFSAVSTMIAYGANIPPPAPLSLIAKWNLEPRNYFLIVGRLVPDNNADLIVREFIASASPRKMVVVGDVPYRDRYAEVIRQLADPRLVFTGYVTDPGELAALYQNCYAYCHGHEFGGTNPALLQALANGCAVCALDTVFNREMLLDGEYGFFFGKERGGLGRLINELEGRGGDSLAGLRRRAPERIRENYSWEKITEQYRQLFTAMIRGPVRDTLTQIDLIGTRIHHLDMIGVLEQLERLVARRCPRQVITANVDQLVTKRNDAEIGRIFREAALVVADGVPLLWAARFLGTPLPERINGTDLLERMCELAMNKGFSVFLLGGMEGIAASAAHNLQKWIPGLRVAGTYSPYHGFENDAQENQKIVSLLKEKRPDILFTAFGFPKGIKWIDRYLPACEVPLGIEVGASFVFISRRIKRAPHWMQKRGLEWFWRLIHEPRRLWKRYLLNDPPFFYHVLRQKFAKNKQG